MTDEKDNLYAMRHSLAHIMAAAVLRLWPEAKLGVGPVVDNGFYYDIDIKGISISEDNFSSVEKEMRKIIEEDQKFEKSDQTIKKALDWAKTVNQPYKTELLNDLQRSGTTMASDLSPEELGSIIDTKNSGKVDSVSFYTNGEFTDLCRGPHLSTTGEVGIFKLMRVAGAYWRGKEDNPQMQRLYGVAFTTQKELDDHLDMLREAKLRDHRKLGRELDLFMFSAYVGTGLPLFTPRGAKLRELLERYSQQLRAKRGFEKVWTPHITKTELYKKSGHWEKFGEELFLIKSQETSDELVLKPMNCPHHIQIYNAKPRSYKDLPLKIMETTTDYRDEKSGELHGLSRVRAITQDDSHAFITTEDIANVAGELIDATKAMYGEFGMDLKVELSFRDDSDNYLGDAGKWETAQKQLIEVADKMKLDYKVIEGEAAFYGPKIDFIAYDTLGRDWQLATVQLDFVQPERFELEYTNSSGNAETPVMIHCALLGSLERFLSVYIEHTAGRFPFWMAPEQVRVLLINDEVKKYTDEITKQLDLVVLKEPLELNQLRYTVDARNESLGRKIKEAEILKIPVMFIVGPKDAEARQVSVRTRDGEEKVKLSELQGWVESFKG